MKLKVLALVGVPFLFATGVVSAQAAPDDTAALASAGAGAQAVVADNAPTVGAGGDRAALRSDATAIAARSGRSVDGAYQDLTWQNSVNDEISRLRTTCPKTFGQYTLVG